MHITVRYWLATPPIPYDGHKWDDPAWIDHSTHAASRLGLHNAILAAEDRFATLRLLHPETPHGCVIFVVQEDKLHILSVHEADMLLDMLEHGEFSWETIKALLENRPEAETPTDLGSHRDQVMAEDDSGRRKPADVRLAQYSGEADEVHHLNIDA